MLDAAIEVFGTKGLKGSSIRDVALAAGVAAGTIYNYFESKPDLILGVLHRLNESEQRAEQLGDRDGETFEQSFAASLRHRFVIMTDQPGIFPALFAEILTTASLRKRYLKEIVTPNFELARPGFQALVERGQMRDIDVDAALRVMSSAFVGLLLLNAIGEPGVRRQWRDMPDLLADILLRGLLPEAKQ